MQRKNKVKISYEPEADILMWEMTDKPIDYAKEIGDVVVHFTKDNIPVLIEILEASKFLGRATALMKKEGGIPIRQPTLTIRDKKLPENRKNTRSNKFAKQIVRGRLACPPKF